MGPPRASTPLQGQNDWLESGALDNLSEEDLSISSEDDEDMTVANNRIRSRPMPDIWNAQDVWERLQNLPGVAVVTDAIKNDNFNWIDNNNEPAPCAAVLIAAWTGNTKLLATLLENGSVANVVDDHGRTALHLAAYCGSSECVDLLLRHGAHVNVEDGTENVTPLHCVASSGSLECVKLLLAANADVNAGIAKKSALHYAVQSNAIDCVRELLVAGACPTTSQIFTETPLHVAAALGLVDCIKILLEYGAEVKVQYGQEKNTPLHLASEDGNAECVQLLVDAGAPVNAVNNRKQTPLHLAALSQSSETIEILLKHQANPNAGDADGRTPLHSAIVKVTRYCECVNLLIKAGANVNQPDHFGYTPLHIAALNEFSNCVLLLLHNGGDVTARTNGGVAALSFIVRRTPDVIPKYISKLDHSIKLNDHDIGDVDCELKLDFRMLVPSQGKGETDLMLTFIEVGQRNILTHPLCETFLYLKWKRIRKFFLFSLAFHAVFVLLYTAYIISVFLKDCPTSQTFNTNMISNSDCVVQGYVTVISWLLAFFTLLLVCKEIFQMLHGVANYFTQWENWLQLAIIISVPLCALHGYKNQISEVVNNWQHHVAAIAIFMTWVELMLIVGRFPTFGLYIQMFQTVAVNFSKFLIAYSCLLIAFSLSFGVLFTNYPPFQNLIWGLIKTVIMMSGELEFEDIFYQDYDILYPVTAHLLFATFVVLVTIILANLMVGLAVNDIQGLQQSAGLDRLVRQAQLVAHLESMLFSKLLWCVPKRFLDLCHRSALLISKQYPRAVFIRPNDPREKRIPKYLIHSAYKLIAERKDRPKLKHYKMSMNHPSYPTYRGVKEIKDKLKSTYFDCTQNRNRGELGSYRSLGHAPAITRLTSVTYTDHTPSIVRLKAEVKAFATEVIDNHAYLQRKMDKLIEHLEELTRQQ